MARNRDETKVESEDTGTSRGTWERTVVHWGPCYIIYSKGMKSHRPVNSPTRD